ncbi:MAG TPA: glycosyltransferase, partial [Candidatus Omnitrophota bacterium]|nr:glycosyltransferase [Candidatus Omnitrophota bacterium]
QTKIKIIYQKNRGLNYTNNIAIRTATGNYLMRLDADERVTPELANEIKNLIAKPLPLYVYAIPRQTFFFGRLLRFSDARHDTPVRLLPRDHARWAQPVHEKVETSLPQRQLASPLLHYSTRDMNHYRAKIVSYIPFELEVMRSKGLKARFSDILWKPSAKFLFLYFWKLGILDGVAGFQYAILSAYYYTFRKYWLYWKGRKK